MNRCQTITKKVKTEFGSMYYHIDTDDSGNAIGASISHPGKEPESQIAVLIETLSSGLNQTFAS